VSDAEEKDSDGEGDQERNPAAMSGAASEEVQNEGRDFAATCPGADGTELGDCPRAPRGAR
jgi:hypothetical protein